MQNREKRIFEVTGGRIWVVLIIAAISLTVVFEVGVWVGKKRVINAEREAARQSDVQMRAATKVPARTNLSHKSSPDQPTGLPSDPRVRGGEEGPLEAEKKAAKYTVQVGTFSSYENAVDMVRLLESYEYRAWLSPESDTEKTLYCVFVGRFGARDEAERFGKSLQETLSYVTEYKVREIQE
jgi:cell division septation protein DedD